MSVSTRSWASKRVERGISVVAAVGAVGRHFLRVENKIENVGIVVHADPAKRVQLEAAAGDVREESCVFQGAKVERDSDFLPLVRERFG